MLNKISLSFLEKIMSLGLYLKFGVMKGQISDIVKSRQIIPQNEALDGSFSKKLVSGSKTVIKGQKSRKPTKKVKLRTQSKVYRLYRKMKPCI